MKTVRSEYRSITESKNPPKAVTWLVARATRPSTMSNNPAPISTSPAQRKSTLGLSALPARANSHAAQMLMTKPRNVRTLGLILERASQRTMRSMMAPQPTPMARVKVHLFSGNIVNGSQLQDFQILDAARALHPDSIANLFAQQRPPNWRGGGDLAVGGVSLLAGH